MHDQQASPSAGKHDAERQLTRLLFIIGASIWIWSAIKPLNFSAWLLEQVATVIGVLIVLGLSRSVHFDTRSRIALFSLFCLHTVGTHYTYSLTPYAEFSTGLFGSSPNDWFGWERNHYDRFVHLAYGFLTAHPINQALQQRLYLTGPACAFICFNLVLSSSALYELAEWCAAVVFGGDAGIAYLGTQGDIWDAQADIALAGLGWMIAATSGTLYSRSRPASKHQGVHKGNP